MKRLKRLVVALIIIVLVTAGVGYIITQRGVPTLPPIAPFNNPPTITSRNPPEELLEIKEGDDLSFSISADDPDGDPLSYTWYVDGNAVHKNSPEWMYSTDFGDGGEHKIECKVSDGKGGIVTAEWTVIVHYVRLDVAFHSYNGWWDRGARDRPVWKFKLEYIISNYGDITAHDVRIVVKHDEETHTLSVGEIAVGGSVSVQTSTFIFEGLDGGTWYFEVSAESGVAHTTTTTSITIPAFPRSLHELVGKSREEVEHILKLYITPDDGMVEWRALGKSWIEIRDYVGKRIHYAYDDGEYWQLPYETLERGYGDCEDQAFLLCSMLRAAGVKPTDVYVVLGEVGGEGHAWVALKVIDIFGIEWWIRLEPTAGGLMESWYMDLISTFQGRKVWAKFNDIYCEVYYP